jgi:hypothetical protein
VVAPVVRLEPVPKGGSAVPGNEVPGAATDHPDGAFFRNGIEYVFNVCICDYPRYFSFLPFSSRHF